MYKNKMFEDEKIYIAGPECFYQGGPDALQYMKWLSEAYGFGVTLPNSNPLDMGNPDLQKRADSIFADLKADMNESTAIIADLEAFRGSEPDGGTIYEIGMAYARGIRCYGYTRDKRTLVWKDQKYRLEQGTLYDEKGCPAPYYDLPFSPAVAASTKIVEGDYEDCLKMMMTDIEEEWKKKGKSLNEGGSAESDQNNAACHGGGCACENTGRVSGKRPLVYLSGPDRYEPDAEARYARMKEICSRYGLDAVSPLDTAGDHSRESESWETHGASDENAYVRAGRLLARYESHVRSCDGVLADLNDYRGYECSNDTAFECGMGFQLGKQLFGYMQDTRSMNEKIPNLGEQQGFRDMTEANVENFNYPINLMFSCSMEIVEGAFEEAVKAAAKKLNCKETAQPELNHKA